MKALLLTLFALVVGCSAEPDAEPLDTIRMTFDNLRVEEISSDRAVIRFETSLPSSCEAEYGTAPDALNLSATDPDMAEGELTTTHEVPLEDLSAQTEIFWRARVEDAEGVVSLSELSSFTTLASDDAGEPLQNFSAGGIVAEVSSNFGGGDNASSYGADQAFDGQMATEWATNGDGDAAMVALDLGAVRKITHVAFRSRKMSDGSSIIQSFQLRFDGGEPIGPFDAPDPDQRTVYELENAQSGQVVTFEALVTTGGNTGAKEIEFLGTPKE